MSSRRTLILVGALVAGVLAAFLTFQYVGGIEERAQGDAQLAPIVVALQPVPAGMSADEAILAGLIDVGERRQIDIPANAILRTAEIKGQTSQIAIEPGTIVTGAMFSNETVAANGATAAIAEGMVFTALSVDDVRGVAQLPLPGDYVNITAIGQCIVGTSQFAPETSGGGGTDTSAGTGATGQATESCAISLYQKARIVAVGQALGAAVAAPVGPDGAPVEATIAPSPLLTFELPPYPAQVLQKAASASNITLYLSLVRKDYVPQPIEPTMIIPAEGMNGATPYGGDPEAEKAGS